ncbi:urease [Ophiocordyceps sinensis CO18]|uniref:Urease n=1 Tax=Ophiocordyceps sinensis (strain Co18 / CGMCC 3.14243) TaxID=911162 RepID=T5A8T3_OPHSC|nr:urease [Ophiocordyceps sinensis CO18]
MPKLDKLVISQLGFLAQKRLARGVRLNHSEAAALIASNLQELIRDGNHSVADLMALGATMLGRRHVLPSVCTTLCDIMVEGTFPMGTYLVTVHNPISTDDGDLRRALYGSFLPIPDNEAFVLPPRAHPLWDGPSASAKVFPRVPSIEEGGPYPLSRGNLASPPPSGGFNGMMSMNGFPSAPRSNGGPSPPPSIGRSSNGTNMYSARSEGNRNSTRTDLDESVLGEHYLALKTFLNTRDANSRQQPNKARDKLLRLSSVQFHEL